jgi:hypothetical protein
MATERLSMRKIREILRQKWVLACSHRQVAASLQVSIGTVTGVLRRATHAGLDWDQVQQLSDDVLEARLYGAALPGGRGRPLPDGAYLHAERKKPGVTLELLHLEYLEQHPDGYRYTRFCDYYRQWLARHRLSMRQAHRAGEYWGPLTCLTYTSKNVANSFTVPRSRRCRVLPWRRGAEAKGRRGAGAQGAAFGQRRGHGKRQPWWRTEF